MGDAADDAARGPASVALSSEEIVAPAAIGLPEPTGEPRRTAGRGPIVIALGSPKGGTGKSTAAMLLAVALLKLGHRVGSIDLDGQQATLTRYLANRAARARELGEPRQMPRHYRIEPSLRTSRHLGEQEDGRQFDEALDRLSDCAYVVIDTPGADCHVGRLGCAQADTVLTPLNDSLLDVDVLARIDPRRRTVLGPSEYSRMIWRENDRRVAEGHRPIDWVVIRNRLAHREARNTEAVAGLLRQLAQRLGFRLAAGLSERVVFRELFLNGLTLLDLPSGQIDYRIGRSGSLARREVDELLRTIGVLNQSRSLEQAG